MHKSLKFCTYIISIHTLLKIKNFMKLNVWMLLLKFLSEMICMRRYICIYIYQHLYLNCSLYIYDFSEHFKVVCACVCQNLLTCYCLFGKLKQLQSIGHSLWINMYFLNWCILCIRSWAGQPPFSHVNQ